MKRFFGIIRLVVHRLRRWLARRRLTRPVRALLEPRVVDCSEVIDLPMTLMSNDGIGQSDSGFRDLSRPSVRNAPDMTYHKF